MSASYNIETANVVTQSYPLDPRLVSKSDIAKFSKKIIKEVQKFIQRSESIADSLDYSICLDSKIDRRNPSSYLLKDFKIFVQAMRILDPNNKKNVKFQDQYKRLNNLGGKFDVSSNDTGTEVHERILEFVQKVWSDPLASQGKTETDDISAYAFGTKAIIANQKKHNEVSKHQSLDVYGGSPSLLNAQQDFRRRSMMVTSQSASSAAAAPQHPLKKKTVKLLQLSEGELEFGSVIGIGNFGMVQVARVIANMDLKKKLAIPSYICAFLGDEEYWNQDQCLSALHKTCQDLGLKRLGDSLGEGIQSTDRIEWIRSFSLGDLRSLALLIAAKQRQENQVGNIRYLVRMDLNKAVDALRDNENIHEVYHRRQKNWDELPLLVGMAWQYFNSKLGEGRDIETVLDSIDAEYSSIIFALKLTTKLWSPTIVVKTPKLAGALQTKEFMHEARISPSEAISTATAFYIGAELNQSPILVALYRELGSLESIITKKDPELTDSDLLFVIFDVARGLAALNDRGIIHRDIAPRNILLFRDKDDQLRAEIADYGLAVNIAKDRTSKKISPKKDVQLPIQTTPPETLLSRETHTKSDQWQFALLVQQLLLGQETPFGISDNQIIQQGIKEGRLKPSVNVHSQETPIRQYLAQLINWIGEAKTPDQRPDWDQLLASIEHCLAVNIHGNKEEESISFQRATGYGLLPNSNSPRSLQGTSVYQPMPAKK